MQLLWQQETATASDIVQWVTAKKAVSMRTVKTLLRRLVAKKAVGYTIGETNPRIYHYHALVTKESCTGEKADTFMETVDDGEVGEILMQFVGGSKLNNGEVMESGNHSELMHKGGRYARMVEQQRQAEQWEV